MQDLAGFLVVTGIELGFVAIAGVALYLLAGRVTRRADLLRRAKSILVRASLLVGLAVVLWNVWLVVDGVPVRAYTLSVLQSLGTTVWSRFGSAMVRLAFVAVAIVIFSRVLRYSLERTALALTGWNGLKQHQASVRAFFAGLGRVVTGAAWLLLLVLAFRLVGAPEEFTSVLVKFVRAYVVIGVGLMLVASLVVIVDAIDIVARRKVRARGWLRYYEPIRALTPTLRTCLRYALWVAIIAIALLQLRPMSVVEVWAPRIVQAIGFFFLGRVVVELGRLEIRGFLNQEGLDEMSRRRRATMAPLVRSGLDYAAYFATVVLILASLGFNPLPFLAGAGILGLVVGFGAQSLINDVVSGFFILFENTYLVGDWIEAAGAKGSVEAIEFRTTKIRDSDGRLHIVRNGDVKLVINYSKEYAVAVVPVDVTYDADLQSVFSILQEAGRRLRDENEDVLDDTHIDGIVAFGTSTMTVRTSTRVNPGRHEAAAAALRLAIKEAFDRRASGAARGGLVPAGLA